MTGKQFMRRQREGESITAGDAAVNVGDRVMLTKSIYDHGEEHHPPGWLAMAGEIVVVRNLGAAEKGRIAVSHEDVTDNAFWISRDEYVPHCTRMYAIRPVRFYKADGEVSAISGEADVPRPQAWGVYEILKDGTCRHWFDFKKSCKAQAEEYVADLNGLNAVKGGVVAVPPENIPPSAPDILQEDAPTAYANVLEENWTAFDSSLPCFEAPNDSGPWSLDDFLDLVRGAPQFADLAARHLGCNSEFNAVKMLNVAEAIFRSCLESGRSPAEEMRLLRERLTEGRITEEHLAQAAAAFGTIGMEVAIALDPQSHGGNLAIRIECEKQPVAWIAEDESGYWVVDMAGRQNTDDSSNAYIDIVDAIIAAPVALVESRVRMAVSASVVHDAHNRSPRP